MVNLGSSQQPGKAYSTYSVYWMKGKPFVDKLLAQAKQLEPQINPLTNTRIYFNNDTQFRPEADIWGKHIDYQVKYQPPAFTKQDRALIEVYPDQSGRKETMVVERKMGGKLLGWLGIGRESLAQYEQKTVDAARDFRTRVLQRDASEAPDCRP